VRQMWGMVTYLADRMKKKLAATVELDDLQSGAALGLLQSIRRHDPLKAKLATYATTRMYGAMRDERRELDWVPRLVRSRKEHAVEMRSADTFTPDPRYPREWPEAVARGGDPGQLAAGRDLWRRLRAVLGEKRSRVLELYYRGDYTLKEIGRQLGLSVSRVCRLHAAGLLQARRRLDT
jgi:RNA polymerase sigma factor (sigma-70 family)